MIPATVQAPPSPNLGECGLVEGVFWSAIGFWAQAMQNDWSREVENSSILRSFEVVGRVACL